MAGVVRIFYLLSYLKKFKSIIYISQVFFIKNISWNKKEYIGGFRFLIWR